MSELLDRMLGEVSLPRFYRVKQHFPGESISPGEIPGVIRAQLDADRFREKLRPGMTVAITGTSRGVANLSVILKSVVDFCRERGALPFIVPAMGSHGGATAEGQKALLAGYGVTEEAMGCPIRATMEVTKIGTTDDGRDAVIDRYAAEADGIILVNRIKLHTAFRGKYESGLMKMMAIGLGKQQGAQTCHSEGYKNMAENLVRFGTAILRNANILFGIAVLENAHEQTGELTALLPEEIPVREPELLQKTRDMMARILVDDADLLIVDEIGKNYSGDGMDPNVTGTFATDCASGGLRAGRVCVLGVSSASHGNAFGIGMAESTTREAACAIDHEAMYINGLTSKSSLNAHMPCVLPNDLGAIRFALLCQDKIDYPNARIVRIRHTMDLEELWLSEAYLPVIKADPRLEILDGPDCFSFDENGGLIGRFRS